MSNKKIYKNRLSLPIFDNKGIGNGNGVAYIPNVIRGGSAIPIGNNMFLMRGRSHAQGGIDIGKDLEVEGNEVVQNGKFGTKVFSSVPFLRGVSPAERVLRGENPDTVFAAQETWKRVNKVADDGSKRAALGLSLFKPNSFKVRRVPINDFITPTLGEVEKPETPTYVLTDDEKPAAKAQEYAKAAEALKAYPYGNKFSETISAIDNTLFDDIKGERGFNKSEMRTIYKYLNDNGSNLSDYAKSAILATIAFESGANIRARNPRSSAKGYFQWLDDRYKFADNLSDEEERKLQLQKIINDMNPTDAFVNKAKDARGWTSVGGRGYLKTAEDFRKAQDTLTAVDLITRGHIRPGNQDWEVSHRKTLADMFYNAIANSKNRKAFGGEDKVYTAPKWAQDSYKKHGKVIIGGTPVINPYLQGSAFALMRNPLLRTLTRDAKNLYSTLGTGIQKAFVTSANGIGKLVPNKYLGSYDKLINNIYSTFIGDAGKDILKETRKGWKYYPNLERLPATINNTVDTVNNLVNEKQFGGMKLNIFKLGGLSRSKDYGSKDKPYPSVNKNDFAGGGRSYPIPTRADAVDALRLAGLHHRSDVRAKVYAKYPDLKKKAAAAGTKINEIPNNNDGLVVGDNLSFNQAFGTARRAGFHIFTWRGKRYTTNLADSTVDNNTYEGGTLPDLVVTGNRGRNANTILLREQNEDRINNLNSKSNTSNKKESTKSTTLGDRIKNVLTNSSIGSLFRNFNWTPKTREDYNPAEHPRRNVFVEGMKKQIEFNDALNRDWNRYKESRKNNSIRTSILGRREIPTPGIFGGGEFGGGGAGTRFGNATEVQEDKYELVPVPVATRRTFNEAFADARKKGLKTFDFNGKKYTTELGNNPKSQSAGNRRYEDRLDIALIPRKKENKNRKGTNEDIVRNTNRRLVNSVSTKFAFGGRKIAKDGIYTPEEIANMTDVELLRRIIDPTTDPLWSRSKYNPKSYNYSFIEDRFSRGKRNKAVEAARNRLNELNNSYGEPISVNRARELFKDFYHRENQPIFETNPLVSRFYNYGWSHNSNGRTVSPTESLDTANKIAGYKLSSNPSRRRNTNTGVSPAAQRILDNAEIAPYQNFRTPSLTEVASRYPISERINVGTGTAPISSPTGVQPNPTDAEAVRSGNFKAIDNDRYVPIRTTTEDWIGLGANLLGSIGSYLGTRAMLNRYPMPNKPVPAIAQKLKTRVNINPQLDTIREQVGRLNTSIDNNTSSSRVAQARKQGVMNNAVASRNQLFGQKENAETQLINQDIMNRQRIGLYNNQIFNDYLGRLGATRQYIAGAGINNINNLISGANQSVQDLLGRIDDRDANIRDFIFMQAAYPNVNWRNIFGNRELAHSLGFRFLNS